MEIFIRGLVALGIALAVAAYGFSDTKPTPTPAGAAVAPATGDGSCGWAPGIKHLFGKGHFGSSGHGHGKFGLGGSGSGSDMGRGPRTQPGTVVFPQHPFVRGPRDFFMVD